MIPGFDSRHWFGKLPSAAILFERVLVRPERCMGRFQTGSLEYLHTLRMAGFQLAFQVFGLTVVALIIANIMVPDS